MTASTHEARSFASFYGAPAPDVIPPAHEPAACRGCGCTADDCSVCIGLTGEPCSWVTHDICSACVSQAERLLRLYAKIGNRSVSAGPLFRAAGANWRGNGPALAVIERAGELLRVARPNASW